MLSSFLLTPLLLAAEPVSINIPESTYDHRSQTSTFTALGDRLAAAKCCTTKSLCTYSNKNACGDSNFSTDQRFDP
jgi:hypothetical protein